MKTLEITLDLETCSLRPTAAIMSIGAVAWNSENKENPFAIADGSDSTATFSKHVDLRSSFIGGLSFDNPTAQWWQSQPKDIKNTVLQHDETPLMPVQDVITEFFMWVSEVTDNYGYDSVNLWSQGSDFDIAILRNVCHVFNLKFPLPHTHLRDHRTFFLEGARILCLAAGSDFDIKRAYSLVEPYDGDGNPHEPIYDCKRSIYSTWQMMNHLRCLEKK